MRSLAVKLTLAFLFVGLIGAVLVAVIVRQRTQVEFDQFIQNRDESILVRALTDYYQTNGSWEGLALVIRQGAGGESLFPGQWFRRGFQLQSFPFLLVGSNGRTILSARADDIGKHIPERDLQKGIAIEVDGETVGWLVPRPAPSPWAKGTPEGNFLTNVNQAALISALAAVLIALLLGGFLAYTLTRTLRELTNATHKVASGDLGYQVEVRSNDELGELAASFNQMSADLARSNRARKQMTADIAHDLRSPLSVILGYTEALSDGKLTGTPEVYDVMYQEAGHLSHLIDDLRTLSLADAGELTLNMQPAAPQELLEDIARAYNQQAERKSISLRVDASPDSPKIIVDPNRMTQVFGNLMSNALRYTPQGGQVVLGAVSEGSTVRLYIRDNGPGIPAEDQPHVFDRFYKGDTSRQHNGETGLGLAIAKSLVELQGGAIAVESEPDSGTTFTIQFPAGEMSRASS